MFFRLFFSFQAFYMKGAPDYPSLIIHSITKLKEYIYSKLLNFMIIKKLWTSRHTFCYIRDDRKFPENLFSDYGRG